MQGDRIAAVTGASRGIGRAIAQHLCKAGYTTFLLARDREALECLAGEIEREGGKAHPLPTDVCKVESVVQAFQTIADRYGRLDVLVNNAGIGVFAPIASMSPDDFDRVIRTNLHGAFYCAQQAIPLMRRAGGGYIINIGSLAGVNTFPGGAAYCASKFALRALSEVLMLEVRYDNIKVTTLAPGSVNTGFPGQRANGNWKIDPNDIGETVLFLLRMEPRALSSYIEMRPLKPPRKG